MNILKTIELYTLNGCVIYSSIKLLLKLRNGCLELPADNEVVSWAQCSEYWDCCPATGMGWGQVAAGVQVFVTSVFRGQKFSSVLGGAGTNELGMCLKEAG